MKRERSMLAPPEGIVWTYTFNLCGLLCTVMYCECVVHLCGSAAGKNSFCSGINKVPSVSYLKRMYEHYYCLH